MNFIKRNIYVIASAVCLAVIGVLYAVQVYKPAEEAAVVIYDANDGEAYASETAGPAAAPDEIVVYITGSVVSPGVYSVPYDARVNEALELAGGFAEGANTDGINLAAKLSDEDHIVVPAIGEAINETPIVTAKTPDSEPATDLTGSVNINTASADELQTLTGIGETIAGYIIAYREANGGFKTSEEIMNVERIGTATYEKIKDSINVK